MISSLGESSRNKKYLNEVAFWYDSKWTKLFSASMYNRDLSNQKLLQEVVKQKIVSPEQATMELSDRRLVHFAYGAWTQDELAWDNLFSVRGEGTGTMGITGKVVNNIKKLIYDN